MRARSASSRDTPSSLNNAPFFWCFICDFGLYLGQSASGCDHRAQLGARTGGTERPSPSRETETPNQLLGHGGRGWHRGGPAVPRQTDDTEIYRPPRLPPALSPTARVTQPKMPLLPGEPGTSSLGVTGQNNAYFFKKQTFLPCRDPPSRRAATSKTQLLQPKLS